MDGIGRGGQRARLREYWPEAPERISPTFEAIDVIHKLFAASLTGKEARHRGTRFKLESSRLRTMPEGPPPILVATAGPVTAKRAGKTVDGIITLGAPVDRLAILLNRFDAGAREAGKDPDQLTKVLRVTLSWAETDEQALADTLRGWIQTFGREVLPALRR